jgi:hypothetical protein
LVLAPAALAQLPPRIGYSSHEEYCRQNPKMPTCIDGSQFKLKPLWGTLPPRQTGQQPAPASRQAPARDWRIPMSPEPLPAGQAQSRLPHAHPGVLLSLRPEALVESKWLGSLIFGAEGAPAQARQGAAAIQEVRLAVGSGANGRMGALILWSAPPAVLAGIGDSFRAKGVTACFVDANTLLIGEYYDVSAAVQRMLAPEAPRTNSPLLPGSRELAQEADFWLTARREFAEANRKAAGAGGFLPEGVTGVSVRVRLRENLQIEMLMHTAGPTVANKLLADANRELIKALAPEEAGALPPEFLKTMKATRTPHGVKMELTIGPSQLPAPLVEQLRSAFAPLREALSGPAPQTQKKAVIHGL